MFRVLKYLADRLGADVHRLNTPFDVEELTFAERVAPALQRLATASPPFIKGVGTAEADYPIVVTGLTERGWEAVEDPPRRSSQVAHTRTYHGTGMNFRRPEVRVTAEEYGEHWPFSVPEGLLRCEGEGSLGAVTFEADGVTYALNGTARSLTDLPDVHPIWLPDGDAPPELNLKKSLGPIIQRGLALCLPPSSPQEPPAFTRVTANLEEDGTTSAQATLMSRVFLCHASNDREPVRRLYSARVQAGEVPWLDEFDLLPGQDWEREIRRAVRASEAVVVCLSNAALSKRGFVQKEIRIALDVADEMPEGQTFLIPLRLEPCQVPDRLARWQWVDYFEESGLDRLLKALRHARGE